MCDRIVNVARRCFFRINYKCPVLTLYFFALPFLELALGCQHALFCIGFNINLLGMASNLCFGKFLIRVYIYFFLKYFPFSLNNFFRLIGFFFVFCFKLSLLSRTLYVLVDLNYCIIHLTDYRFDRLVHTYMNMIQYLLISLWFF